MNARGKLSQLIRCWLRLDEAILRKLDYHTQLLEKIMSVEDDIKAAIADIATEVTTLGTDADAIIAKLGTVVQPDGSIPAADAAELLASLQGISTAAKAVGTKMEAAVAPPPPPSA